jgi:hypothetical protein
MAFVCAYVTRLSIDPLVMSLLLHTLGGEDVRQVPSNQRYNHPSRSNIQSSAAVGSGVGDLFRRITHRHVRWGTLCGLSCA